MSEDLRDKLLNLRITVWKQADLNGQANLDHDSVEDIMQLILDAIKRAKPDEVEPGLIWGENVARGYNKSIRLYEQNLMKELLGE